jgi:hypothetical protein
VERQKKGEMEIEVFRRWFEKQVILTNEDGRSESIFVVAAMDTRPTKL